MDSVFGRRIFERDPLILETDRPLEDLARMAFR
jgi:hypothetical protein